MLRFVRVWLHNNVGHVTHLRFLFSYGSILTLNTLTIYEEINFFLKKRQVRV